MGVATDGEAAESDPAGPVARTSSGYRDRENWKLGDIIHSTPVVVGAASNFVDDESYQEFLTAPYSNRQKMVYVGANDGMLHAFDAADG